MISNQDLFNKIQLQFDRQLPFVVFREPLGKTLTLVLQDTDTLERLNSFEKEGFVFAPFDHSKKGVLLHPDTIYVSEYHGLSDSMFSGYQKAVEDSGKENHVNLVSMGIDKIKDGLFSKVVLSRFQEVPSNDLKPLEVYNRLLNRYRNAFAYFWYHPKVGMWMGATPETLIDIKGQHFKTMALAGTQKYNDSEEVCWGQKELDEQKIVTDFILESLAGLSDDLEVSEVTTIRAGNLLHLKTDIRGELNKSFDVKDLIETLHPTPAVCGYPKDQSNRFILQHENYDRKFYTGYLGYFNGQEERSSFYVNLRCMQLFEDKAVIYVGGGITQDSDPVSEWEETVNKSQTMLNALG
ncbi:isochorismate synthase [Zhouia amylolytica]|uniref:isochorismate synthase n=1 Tax=Zhouia amylolytica TaxID=376730 RepID=A0A1I6UES3_9FLAO|nr:isochorismate synthase [Zhouia amylolytica]SFS99911.1 isochorismate synthase [Zhouia amylolytica]